MSALHGFAYGEHREGQRSLGFRLACGHKGVKAESTSLPATVDLARTTKPFSVFTRFGRLSCRSARGRVGTKPSVVSLMIAAGILDRMTKWTE